MGIATPSFSRTRAPVSVARLFRRMLEFATCRCRQKKNSSLSLSLGGRGERWVCCAAMDIRKFRRAKQPERLLTTDLFFPQSLRDKRRHWGRAAAYSSDFSLPEPIALTGESVVQEGPFYRNSKIRIADVIDGLSNTVFLGEHTSSLSNKTWFGTVPFAATCPKPGWPSECNSAGCLVGAHSGPDTHDHPQVIIHAPNHPFGHTDQMHSDHAGGAQVLMGDGSTRFVSQFTNPFVWVAVSTCATGEIIDGGL